MRMHMMKTNNWARVQNQIKQKLKSNMLHRQKLIEKRLKQLTCRQARSLSQHLLTVHQCFLPLGRYTKVVGGDSAGGFIRPIPKDGGADQPCGVPIIRKLRTDGIRGPEYRGNDRRRPGMYGEVQGSLVRDEKGPVIQNHRCYMKESRLEQSCGDMHQKE